MMYYVVYGLLWVISLLPLKILYFLSDCIYGLIFYVFQYRKDIVMNNLLIAFPEKTEQERKQIAKKFYHNLIDTFIETIKMVSASKHFFLKRFTANWDVVNEFKQSGKNIQIHLGHNFNWEWGNAAGSQQLTMPFVGVYMPITNKILNKLFYNLRSSHVRYWSGLPTCGKIFYRTEINNTYLAWQPIKIRDIQKVPGGLIFSTAQHLL